jgi:hypothetical protein
MLGRRDKRPEADASASAGGTASISIPVPTNHVELMQERLQRLHDEEKWASSHTTMVVAHNKASLAFWLLCSASLCFALLNGYHGFTSSGAFTAGMASVVIAILYFTIELTVPISAHLMSWGSKGQARWAIRMIGIAAYVLGVCFSLLILQGKFSSGANSAAVKADAAAALLSTDKEQLARARQTAAELRGKVGSRSADSIMSDMKAVLATQITKRDTLGDVTDECQGNRRNSQQRDLCAKYETLRSLHADAIALARADDVIEKSAGRLADGDRFTGIGGDAQDKIFSSLLGTSLDTIQLFKASFIAVMAALLTHLLWAAHGMTVNIAIAKHRDEMFEKNALGRALEREEDRKRNAAAEAERARAEAERMAAAEKAARDAELARTAAETTAQFLAAKGTNNLVAQAVASAPLREQPVAIQLQRYFTERAIMGADFTMQVGIFHDDYAVWCQRNGLSPVPVDRFVQLVKDIGMHISVDGRVVGAALRSR